MKGRQDSHDLHHVQPLDHQLVLAELVLAHLQIPWNAHVVCTNFVLDAIVVVVVCIARCHKHQLVLGSAG